MVWKHTFLSNLNVSDYQINLIPHKENLSTYLKVKKAIQNNLALLE